MKLSNTFRLRIRLMATLISGAIVLGTFLWMVIGGVYRLWAWILALLCLFAVALRGYALEWRRQRDAAAQNHTEQ